MPPTLALVLTLGFIGFLFRRDFRQRPNVTSALWLPTLWMFFMASRPPMQWLRIAGLSLAGGSWEEGNPIDAIVFLSLTMAGFFVLNKRRVNLARIMQENAWLTAFVFYCLLAIVWSDFPFVGLKRWIKILGHPVMVLVIFSEPDPLEAVMRVMKRLAYVVLPVSILWIKYFPRLGRAASDWGAMVNCGISQGKNALGGICMIIAFIFIWHSLQVWPMPRSKERKWELYLMTGLLLMAAYLLRKAHSATSWMALMISVGTMVVLRMRSINKKVIGAYAVIGVILLVILQLTFDIYGHIVDVSGHEATIEGRGRLWQVLLQIDTNPILGAGFESFWLGDRLEQVWAQIHGWRPGQAHNGYLELYLNLGMVGLALFAALIIAVFQKARRELFRNPEWGIARMCLLFAILAHNWTEAGFRGLSLSFFIFFLIAIHYPGLRMTQEEPSAEVDESEPERELVYG